MIKIQRKLQLVARMALSVFMIHAVQLLMKHCRLSSILIVLYDVSAFSGKAVMVSFV